MDQNPLEIIESMQHKLNFINVVCYKWGTLYSSKYVNIISSMLRRHLPVPHELHCITDDSNGLSSSIIVHSLPDFGVDGIWRKLMTFQEDFIGLKDQYVLSIDLDVVIVGCLGFVLENPDFDFVIARNWSRKGSRASGCIYRLKVGSHITVWEDFISDPETAIDQNHGKNRLIGEQKWLDKQFKEFKFFPEEKVISYKRHCRSKGRKLKLGNVVFFNSARFGKSILPKNSSIVSFHGDPSPEQVCDKHYDCWRKAPFVKEHWCE